MVWVYKLDDGGRRADTSLGFVIAPGQVATAFQAIDEATRLEVEFADGRKVGSREIWACSRLQDWALVKVDTGSTPALRRVESGAETNGERYFLFNVAGNGARVIGAANLSGRRTVPGYGDRIQIQPSPTREAAGGPLLTSNGLVAGIVGGSVTPGSRISPLIMSENPELWPPSNAEIAVTPIAVVPVLTSGKSARFDALLDSGVLTPPIAPNSSLISAGLAKSIFKNPNDGEAKQSSEFSHGDKIAWIYTAWQKKSRNGKGEVTAKVYDARNRLLVDLTPQTISLPDAARVRVPFEFALQKLAAGVYRVEILWNDKPAWRAFLTVTD